MRYFATFMLGVSFGVAAGFCAHHAGRQAASRDMAAGGVQVHFSPKGGCTDAIVAAIQAATHEILVQDYSFTSEPIAQALIAAHKNGVTVRVIMDKSVLNEKSQVDNLHAAGIDVWIDSRHAIAHNKIIVIDGATVLTGSFNFTKQAETSNAENLLLLPPSEGVGPIYEGNWNAHVAHSTKFEGRPK